MFKDIQIIDEIENPSSGKKKKKKKILYVKNIKIIRNPS